MVIELPVELVRHVMHFRAPRESAIGQTRKQGGISFILRLEMFFSLIQAKLPQTKTATFSVRTRSIAVLSRTQQVRGM